MADKTISVEIRSDTLTNAKVEVENGEIKNANYSFKPVSINQSDQNTLKWFLDYLPLSETQSNQSIEIFIDGKDYFNSLYDSILTAKQEICLTGLHFAGHFHLKRTPDTNPNGFHDETTLQRVLAKKSKEGVHIYLLVNLFWKKEGLFVKDYENLSRDPDYIVSEENRNLVDLIKRTILEKGGLSKYLKYTYNFFKYLKENGNKDYIHAYCDHHKGYIMHSNHQKTIIIDRSIAYQGGLDLTDIDGDRWDSIEHKPDNPTRNFQKTETSWHDIQLKVENTNVIPNSVDFIYANFLGRYNYGYLYLPSMSYSEALKNTSIEEKIPEMENGDVDLQEIDMGSLPKLTPKGRSCKDYVKGPWIFPKERLSSVLNYPITQVVRSMPEGNWDNYEDNQHPNWNLAKEKGKTTEFEHSARDAYIKGIENAEKYIYLENQWVADEKIWSALKRKATEKANDPNFRIIILIPKRFLEAAGYGRDQDINLDSHLKDLHNILKYRFGVFSSLQPIGHFASSSEHFKVPECVWEYIYIHSKIMIIDDIWTLIGSANAGGISLTGVGFKSEPDTELSMIILDERKSSIVTKFRKDLWEEHLGRRIDSYAEAINDFHNQAMSHTYDTKNESRIHFNSIYYPFAPSTFKGVWKHLKWEIIEKQMNYRIQYPKNIHHTYYDLSAPLTVVEMLASSNKSRYEKLVRDIFTLGKSEECNIDVEGEDLLDQIIESKFPIMEIDWMLGSSMVDSSNWYLDYEGKVNEKKASRSSDGDMIDYMKNLLQCESVNKINNEYDNDVELTQIINSTSPNNSKFVAIKIDLEFFFEENESLIKSESEDIDFDRYNTKYWYTFIKDHNFVSQLYRERPSFYPGVLTSRDLLHSVLPSEMFIRLLDEIQVIEDVANQKKIQFTFWTWGETGTVSISEERFKKSISDFFVAN